MTAFEHDAVMVDAHVAEVGRPGFEGGTVRYRERQMIQARHPPVRLDGARGDGALVSTTTNFPPRCPSAT